MSKTEFIELMNLLNACKIDSKEQENSINKRIEHRYDYNGINIILYANKEQTTYPYNFAEIRTIYEKYTFQNIYELICGINSIFDNIDVNDVYHKVIKNIIQKSKFDSIPFLHLKNADAIEPEIIELINQFDEKCLLLDDNKIDKLKRKDSSFSNSDLSSSFKIGDMCEYIEAEYKETQTKIVLSTKEYTFIHTKSVNKEDSMFDWSYFNIRVEHNEKENMSYDLKRKKLVIGEMYREHEISINDSKNYEKFTFLIKLGIQLADEFYNVDNFDKIDIDNLSK